MTKEKSFRAGFFAGGSVGMIGVAVIAALDLGRWESLAAAIALVAVLDVTRSSLAKLLLKGSGE